jgi:hypothetical protein
LILRRPTPADLAASLPPGSVPPGGLVAARKQPESVETDRMAALPVTPTPVVGTVTCYVIGIAVLIVVLAVGFVALVQFSYPEPEPVVSDATPTTDAGRFSVLSPPTLVPGAPTPTPLTSIAATPTATPTTTTP